MLLPPLMLRLMKLQVALLVVLVQMQVMDFLMLEAEEEVPQWLDLVEIAQSLDLQVVLVQELELLGVQVEEQELLEMVELDLLLLQELVD
jgi:hypothetical protein